MFWTFGDDFPDESQDMNYRTSYIITRIQLIKSRNLITLDDNKELDLLRQELDEIRKTCSHSFVPILLFVQHHSYCRYCDKEDHTYKHQD